MYTHSIVIGDWSKDGHEKSDIIYFECSHPENDVKYAYEEFVEKYGITLEGTKKGQTEILSEYEENRISAEVYEQLKAAGIDFTNICDLDGPDETECLGPGEVAILFLEMVKTQLSGFTYKIIDGKKPINGFWSKDFNYSFGYGVYS